MIEVQVASRGSMTVLISFLHANGEHEFPSLAIFFAVTRAP
ncbi:hypothetical protein ACFFUB_11400 [Algimonas porphyrae]|nr:hypothetical protein [Algimonas porphyrae]